MDLYQSDQTKQFFENDLKIQKLEKQLKKLIEYIKIFIKIMYGCVILLVIFSSFIIFNEIENNLVYNVTLYTIFATNVVASIFFIKKTNFLLKKIKNLKDGIGN
jgi:fatty acid desaturase